MLFGCDLAVVVIVLGGSGGDWVQGCWMSAETIAWAMGL
jgi:hypothetical protein